MKRRTFIARSSVGVVGLSLAGANCSKQEQGESRLGTMVEKVKTAMLSMQRASWEQGVAAQALLEFGDHEMAYLMAREAVLRQTDEGRLAVVYTDNGVTDPAASGEAVLRSGERFNDPALKKAAGEMLDYLLNKAPRSEAGTLYHTLNAPQIWVDSLYMAPPFLAIAGQHDEAVTQIKGIRDILWNPANQLFSHIWDDSNTTFVNENFWGVGNGWAAAGIMRVIRALPESMAREKKELISCVREVLDGCLAHIRSDGLFHNIVDHKKTFVETNLSQMLSYSIFRGVQEKWLENSYLEVAYKMRKAAHDKVDSYGYVQDVCGAPFFNSPGRATEGQAFFILMEAAYRDYQNGNKSSEERANA